MKKVFLVLAAFTLVFATSCSSDDDNDTSGPIGYPEKIYNGDVTLSSPLEIEQFGSQNYTKIVDGYLTITDPNNNQNITSLEALSSLSSIEGGLVIEDAPYLQNLNGLNNITSISYIYITNTSINTLSHLENLTELYSLNLTNTALNTLNGLDNIITDIRLKIVSNNNLTTLNGLQNTASATTLNINSNILLSNFCALNNVTLGYGYNVYDNAYNPTLEDLQNGNCNL